MLPQRAPKQVTADCKSCNKYGRSTRHNSASGLIDEIMKKYFCQKAGQSSSSCTLFSDRKGSAYSMDTRLLYWSRILEDRRKIACRIQKATGKRASHVLYNRLEEHRNVQNVKRIMDYAQRLDPSKLSTRTANRIGDLFETLPRSERLQTNANLHIVGTPKISQAEQRIRECVNPFLTSSILHGRLNSQVVDMSNVLEFYPDIDQLQVVGQRIHKHPQSAVDRISDFGLSAMSSNSDINGWDWSDFPENCIQIDDTILTTDDKSTRNLNFKLKFKCLPFESQTQTLCRVMNLGRKSVQLKWRKIQPHAVLSAFIFNRKMFRITYGEIEDIQIIFKPTQRMVCQEEWWIQTEPNFFEEPCRIHVKLSAECHIPEDYFSSMIWDLLESVICNIIPGPACQQRIRTVLTEREVFDKLNPGFNCQHEDLRKFKEIYRQIREKSSPSSWDLNLQTLKLLIEAIADHTQRSKYFEAFMQTIREMRQRFPNSDARLKVLLARGLILSLLDRWESKAVQIVDAVARTHVDALIIRMPFDFVVEQLKQCETVEEKRKTIQHNALYIQLYCSICDLAEDMVLFMENCCLLLQDF